VSATKSDQGQAIQCTFNDHVLACLLARVCQAALFCGTVLSDSVDTIHHTSAVAYAPFVNFVRVPLMYRAIYSSAIIRGQ